MKRKVRIGSILCVAVVLLLAASAAQAAGPYPFYSEPAIANGAIVPLTTDPGFNISTIYGTAIPGGRAHVILDVTGYFQ